MYGIFFKLLNLRLRNINKSDRHFENWKPSLLYHLAVIIARENEILDQSARAIFDNNNNLYLWFLEDPHLFIYLFPWKKVIYTGLFHWSDLDKSLVDLQNSSTYVLG